MFEKSENISQHLPTSKKLKGIQIKYIHWCTPPRASHRQAKPEMKAKFRKIPENY